MLYIYTYTLITNLYTVIYELMRNSIYTDHLPDKHQVLYGCSVGGVLFRPAFSVPANGAYIACSVVLSSEVS